MQMLYNPCAKNTNIKPLLHKMLALLKDKFYNSDEMFGGPMKLLPIHVAEFAVHIIENFFDLETSRMPS